LFGPLTLAETDTRTAAVLVDEFDAVESMPHNIQNAAIRHSAASRSLETLVNLDAKIYLSFIGIFGNAVRVFKNFVTGPLSCNLARAASDFCRKKWIRKYG
jgi:hypothetical protein